MAACPLSFVILLVICAWNVVHGCSNCTVGNSTSIYRCHDCFCQEENVTCTKPHNQSTTLGTHDGYLNHTKFYKCLCQEQPQNRSDYNTKPEASNLTLYGVTNLTRFYDCAFQEDNLNSSTNTIDLYGTNLTICLLYPDGTFTECIRNLTKSFRCSLDMSERLLECVVLELWNRTCNDTESPASSTHESKPPTTTELTTTTPTTPPTTANSLPNTALDTKALVIIYVIIGVNILLAITVCACILCKRRQKNANYKRERQKVSKIAMSNHASHDSDSTNPKTFI